MTCFSPRYTTTGKLIGFSCTQCCRSVAGSRLVRKCWHPGCVNSCQFYDAGCVPPDSYKEDPDRKFVCSEFLLWERDYHRHVRKAGECTFCSGSCLSATPGEGPCIRCRGTGVCQECGGKYFRSFDDLPTHEQDYWRWELGNPVDPRPSLRTTPRAYHAKV